MKVTAEDTGVGVLGRVGYEVRRQEQREWVVESRGVKILKVWRVKSVRRRVYRHLPTGTVVFVDEVVESVARCVGSCLREGEGEITAKGVLLVWQWCHSTGDEG